MNTKSPPGEICMLQKDFTKNVERHLYSKVRSHLLVAFNFGEQYASCWYGTNKEIKAGIFNFISSQGEIKRRLLSFVQLYSKLRRRRGIGISTNSLGSA